MVSGYERPQSMVQKSVDLFLQEMDEAGVDKGILVGRQAGHRVVANDDIAELRDQYPGRFPLSVAGINGSDVPAALREVERTITKMGFNGIAVDPGWWVPAMYVDDPRIYPIYAKCQELGVVMYLTCSLMQGPDISYAEPWRIQRVANDFPTLQIVVVHGAFPYTSEMIGVMIANAPLGNLWVPRFSGSPGLGRSCQPLFRRPDTLRLIVPGPAPETEPYGIPAVLLQTGCAGEPPWQECSDRL
jgi:predicted TIM-barrel fold metal-dependent hydrolase